MVNVVAFVLAVVVIAAVHLVLTRTQLGTALRAAAADPATASTLGINISRMHALTFGAAAAIAALAGIVYGTAFSVNPDAGLPLLILGFTVVVIGGVGSVLGTLLGGVAGRCRRGGGRRTSRSGVLADRGQPAPARPPADPAARALDPAPAKEGPA